MLGNQAAVNLSQCELEILIQGAWDSQHNSDAERPFSDGDGLPEGQAG